MYSKTIECNFTVTRANKFQWQCLHKRAATCVRRAFQSSLIMSAPFSPIMIAGALVLPLRALLPTIETQPSMSARRLPLPVLRGGGTHLTMDGMIDASSTRKFFRPLTRPRGLTTAVGSASLPILQVPTGW